MALAQSAIDRSANVNDGWTVKPGIVEFNFVHRFQSSGPPTRKVINFPTFYMVAGLPHGFNAGIVYATNSSVFSGVPNEYEIMVRHALTSGATVGGIGASVTGAYNSASESADGELELTRTMGKLRVLGAVRGMSRGYDAQRAMAGAGGGLVYRLTTNLSVAGDYSGILNRQGDAALDPAWSGSLAWHIPHSPHSLSFQITNANSGTIEGSTVGLRHGHREGFEFTIPIQLKSLFGG